MSKTTLRQKHIVLRQGLRLNSAECPQHNPERNRRIVCIGGGTGTSVVLASLKKYPLKLSAVVSMFDGGAGSSGCLRDELGVLPPGDARQCLLSLTKKGDLADLFNYRFDNGRLKGHNLGNLFMAAAEKSIGGFDKGIEELSKILDIKDQVIPVTLDNCHLKAILKDGKTLKNEDRIINYPSLSKIGIKELYLEPRAQANPKAIKAIKKADLVIIGPGKFYTSLIPHFLVTEIAEAVRKTNAKKVFICNLMTQVGNTDGFSVEDFLSVLEKYLGKGVIDYVIFNTGKLSPTLLKQVKKVFPEGEFIKYNRFLLAEKGFIGKDIIDRKIRRLDSSDIFVNGANQRTMVLHQSEKLAKIIINLLKN